MIRLFASLVAVAALCAGTANAQNYPTRPVTLIVPFAAGGPTDIVARIIGENMSKTLGQQIVVENVAGAGGTTGITRGAQARPDGYTLMMGHMGTHGAAPALYPNLRYDPTKDFEPVGLAAGTPILIVAKKDLPPKTLAEFVAAMKARPDGYNYGSSGVGSTQHVAGEALNLAAGTQAKHVPYKGSSAAHIDLIGGQVQFMIDTTSSAMGQIKAGKLRPLAVTTATRSSQLPDVPTMQEAGYPSVGITTWYGLYATGGTPKAVIDKLHAELQRALKLPDVQERLRGLLECCDVLRRGACERSGARRFVISECRAVLALRRCGRCRPVLQ